MNVTWEEARDYVAWLSSATGKRYRLPTEADWVAAARVIGPEPRLRVGRVREWTEDEAAEAEALAQRWVRGVSYADPATDLLSARRARAPDTRDALTGFRAVREIKTREP